MYILIEHSGSDKHIEMAEFIKQAAEDLGFTYEEAATLADEPLTIYDEDLTKIAELKSIPDSFTLHYYLSTMEEKDNDPNNSI
mgnify:FL=1